MFELRQVTNTTYYIESPARIGIYLLSASEVCVIDSGLDEGTGKRLAKIMEEHGWRPRMLIATHAHADHIGGMAFLQKKYGCPAYAPQAECAYLNDPFLLPSFLYGGYPFGELRQKFFLAQTVRALPLTPDCLPEGFALLPLPGHAFAMTGVRTPDDVWFLGDCCSSAATLEKYHIPLLYDVDAFLKTLDTIASLRGRLLIPSHTEATDSLAETAALNRAKMEEIMTNIEHFCATPISHEALLTLLFDHYALHMDLTQFVLVGHTLRCYLSYMYTQGRLQMSFAENRMLWQTVATTGEG